MLQASGGMDYLIQIAVKLLRANPHRISYYAPLISWVFTFMCGTGNIVFGILPVIAEVSREAGVEEYLERVKNGTAAPINEKADIKIKTTADDRAKTAVMLYLLATVIVVAFGIFPSLRPTYMIGEDPVTLSMTMTIEIVMMIMAGVIIMACKVNVASVLEQSVYKNGLMGVYAIFGLSWAGDTLVKNNLSFLKMGAQDIVAENPWVFPRAELPDDLGGHCLRPNGHDEDRQISVQSQLHDPGLDHMHRERGRGLGARQHAHLIDRIGRKKIAGCRRWQPVFIYGQIIIAMLRFVATAIESRLPPTKGGDSVTLYEKISLALSAASLITAIIGLFRQIDKSAN